MFHVLDIRFFIPAIPGANSTAVKLLSLDLSNEENILMPAPVNVASSWI